MRIFRNVFVFLAVITATTGCSTMTTVTDSVGSFVGNFFGSFELVGSSEKPVARRHGPRRTVRTTAYSHRESDSLIYGVKTAAGTNLKYGRVRSAAADWSVYPVGTVFKIDGEPYLYEVDDYGSALVGTQTIDIYKPTMSAMRSWGVRNVDIEILRWGSYERSLTILEPRTHKASHVRQMANSIRRKI